MRGVLVGEKFHSGPGGVIYEMRLDQTQKRLRMFFKTWSLHSLRLLNPYLAVVISYLDRHS